MLLKLKTPKKEQPRIARMGTDELDKLHSLIFVSFRAFLWLGYIREIRVIRGFLWSSFSF